MYVTSRESTHSFGFKLSFCNAFKNSQKIVKKLKTKTERDRFLIQLKFLHFLFVLFISNLLNFMALLYIFKVSYPLHTFKSNNLQSSIPHNTCGIKFHLNSTYLLFLINLFLAHLRLNFYCMVVDKDLSLTLCKTSLILSR